MECKMNSGGRAGNAARKAKKIVRQLGSKAQGHGHGYGHQGAQGPQPDTEHGYGRIAYNL